MASQNNLINGVKLEEPVVVVKIERGEHAPCFIFHKDCLEGKMVKTDAEYYDCLAQGWMENIKELKKKIALEIDLNQDSDYENVISDVITDSEEVIKKRGRKPKNK